MQPMRKSEPGAAANLSSKPPDPPMTADRRHLPLPSAATWRCWRWRRRCSCRCRAWASPRRRWPATCCSAPDEKWLATVPIFLVHLGIMGTTIPASLLMAVDRPARRVLHRRAARRRVRACVGCMAIYRQSFPLLCAGGGAAGHAGGLLLVFPPGRRRCHRARLPRQGHLAGHGGRRACGLPRAAGRQVGGRLAGAGDVRRRLCRHGRLLDRRAGADPAAAHPEADRGRARRRRPADARRSCASRPIAWRWPPPCSATR